MCYSHLYESTCDVRFIYFNYFFNSETMWKYTIIVWKARESRKPKHQLCIIASSEHDRPRTDDRATRMKHAEWELVLWVVVVSVARALLSARRQCECECSSAVEGIARADRARRSRFCLARVKRSANPALITHSRVAPLFQGTRTWICPGFPLSNMDARSEGCSFAQWDGHAEHRWWSVFFSLSDHAVITPMTTQHKPVGILRSVQGNDMQFMKMCSPLVTHHRWLGLLLLLLCVGYSHGMPHVLRFGKSLLKHITVITDALFIEALGVVKSSKAWMSNARCSSP